MRSKGNYSPVELYQAHHRLNGVKRNSEWTHCAIYLQDGVMVDAMPQNGTRLRRLQPEAAARDITVLRIKDSFSEEDERLRIAEIAACCEGTPYSSYLGLLLNKPFNSQVSSNGGNQTPKAMVCSTLVEFATDQAGLFLSHVQYPEFEEMLPASLMYHPWLEPVQTSWHLAQN